MYVSQRSCTPVAGRKIGGMRGVFDGEMLQRWGEMGRLEVESGGEEGAGERGLAGSGGADENCTQALQCIR